MQANWVQFVPTRRRWVPVAALISYALLLLVLLPVQSLWLDELMQTAASRDLALGPLLHDEIPRTAGQVPLVYLFQKASLALLGSSDFAARLPSALFSVFACLGIWQLSKWIGLRQPFIAVILFATFPLQLRYATEARPYSQALCISIWLTVVFVRLWRQSTLKLWCAYTGLLTLGLYTQPYTLFAGAAHGIFWLISRREIIFLRNLSISAFLAVASFLPWYLFARAGWKNDVNGSNLHFRMQAKLPLEVARELTGAGYIETVLLLALCYAGFHLAKGTPRDRRWFLLVLLFAPAFLALTADAAFDYFFAVRQVIFVLAPLAILGTLGLDGIASRGFSRLATSIACVLLLLNTAYSIRWFTKPREDWGRAATRLARARATGACIIFLPATSINFYDFYRPGLSSGLCPSLETSWPERIQVAVSPYFRNPGAEAELQRRLQASGFTPSSSTSEEEPHIISFQRKPKAF